MASEGIARVRELIRERGIKSVADLEERRHELLEENHRLRDALLAIKLDAEAGLQEPPSPLPYLRKVFYRAEDALGPESEGEGG